MGLPHGTELAWGYHTFSRQRALFVAFLLVTLCSLPYIRVLLLTLYIYRLTEKLITV